MPTMYDEQGRPIELPYTPAGKKAAAAQREKNRIERERRVQEEKAGKPRPAAGNAPAQRAQDKLSGIPLHLRGKNGARR